MLVLASANGKGIKREIIGPSPQERRGEIAQFGGHKMGKHKLETACFLVKGAKINQGHVGRKQRQKENLD